MTTDFRDNWTVVDEPDDERLHVFQGLRDHTLRQRRERPDGDMGGLFISEGDLVVERALSAGYELHSVLFDGTRNRALPDAIESSGVPLFAGGPRVIEQITGFHLHRGLIACFRRRPVLEPGAVIPGKRSLLILEGINNPTNMGLILRCGAGLGIDGYLMDPTCCDPLYRRSGRVSMGEAYVLPYARLDGFPHGLSTAHDAGVRTLALTPDPEATDIGTLALSPDEPVGLVLGSEGPGLSDETLAACTERVRIPMSGSVDSLNVGTAAAVACYAIQQARVRSAP